MSRWWCHRVWWTLVFYFWSCPGKIVRFGYISTVLTSHLWCEYRCFVHKLTFCCCYYNLVFSLYSVASPPGWSNPAATPFALNSYSSSPKHSNYPWCQITPESRRNITLAMIVATLIICWVCVFEVLCLGQLMLCTNCCHHLGLESPWHRTRPCMRRHLNHPITCSIWLFFSSSSPTQTAPASSVTSLSPTPSPSTYTSPPFSHSISPTNSSSPSTSSPFPSVTKSTFVCINSPSHESSSRFITSSAKTISIFIIVSIRRLCRRMKVSSGLMGMMLLCGGVCDWETWIIRGFRFRVITVANLQHINTPLPFHLCTFCLPFIKGSKGFWTRTLS